MFETTRRRVVQAVGLGGTASLAGCSAAPTTDTETTRETTSQTAAQQSIDVDRIAADPTTLPDPISRSEPKRHEVLLTAQEHVAEIEDGVTFNFMTFDGRVPGPMIRVRQGDTVSFTLENATDNAMPHNVDFHAVYGTGGGNVATTASPGEENAMEFKAEYPGAYIYHCAVPNLDMHISSGMFGMILVEPKEGLPPVDQELYLGQHEVYTDKPAGEEGHHSFDFEAMANEQPTYVLFNGEKYPFTPDNHGTIKTNQGDRVRVFMVTGGPNYSSNFHPIGNVWSRAYRDGALPENGDLEAAAERNVQTMKVPPGSCMIGEMDTPVPERIKLVDHALSRVARRGLMAMVDVQGEKRPEIFDPSPDTPAGEDEEGPIY
ncbi:copper-containing nitrite reductase [Halolamina sp. C58]|uniref:copper-containing nitrite reductase n=1 Tax=Halolamina sp. C58 TaxID=3421640 RepID=UPI003EBF8206